MSENDFKQISKKLAIYLFIYIYIYILNNLTEIEIEIKTDKLRQKYMLQIF